MHSIRTDNSATTRPFKERYTFIPKVRILEIGSMKILKTGKNSEFQSRLYKSSKISHCLFWAEVNYNDSRIDNSTLFFESHFNHKVWLLLQWYMCLRDTATWNKILINGLVMALLSVLIGCTWINTWFFSNRIVEISEW